MVISKKNKKQEIIAAAAGLFKEKGYPASSIRDLAVKVGLEPSSIYSHIQSKEELLITICEECAVKFLEGIRQIAESEHSPKKKIKMILRQHLDIAYNDPTAIAVFSDEWKHLPEHARISFLQSRKEYAAIFKSVLREGRKKGLFDFRDEDITYNNIINMIRWTYFTTDRLDAEDVYESLSEFILKGLKS
jgi:AcrR family transcriptional regulator